MSCAVYAHARAPVSALLVAILLPILVPILVPVLVPNTRWGAAMRH